MNVRMKFAKGNAKLGKETAIFSLPAGFTCPGALQCLSRADRITGKLADGKHSLFRCYAATGENLFPNIRVSRWRNFDALKACSSPNEMVDLINRSIPRKNTNLVRVHASGDFYSQDYFDAWSQVARLNPKLTFYAYTKALPFWISRMNVIPRNFKLVASEGGKFDRMIAEYGLRHVKVVFSKKEARDLGLPIDHDDKHAWKTDGSFALLLHGTQKKGSEASKILYRLRKAKIGGYQSDYFAHYKKKGMKSKKQRLAGLNKAV